MQAIKILLVALAVALGLMIVIALGGVTMNLATTNGTLHVGSHTNAENNGDLHIGHVTAETNGDLHIGHVSAATNGDLHVGHVG